MASRQGQHWIGGVTFTVILLLLISLAVAEDFYPDLFVALAASVTAFLILFPGSLFFNVAFANFLGVYACTFIFFSVTNFPGVDGWVQRVGFGLPVMAFIWGAIWRRKEIRTIVTSQQLQERRHFSRVFLWLIPVFTIGVATFFIPRGLSPQHLDVLFLVAMGAIAAVVLVVSRSVSIFLLDTGLLFEEFFRQMARLAAPAFAFLTFYSLLVIVFACIYRIVDKYTTLDHFRIGASFQEIGFLDALYFSLVTVSTLGYGDITPASRLIQVLVGIQVICGVALLLFGFNEIVRGSLDRRRRDSE